MSDNRRAHGAAGLRAFFDQQIQHLEKLFTVAHGPSHGIRGRPEEDSLLVEDFVEASNNGMRAVHAYSRKLRPSVQALHDHVNTIAGQIPPPIDLNRQAIKNNPLVNALFVNSHDIGKLIDSNPDLSDYLKTQGREDVLFYGLLTACKCEKQALGVAIQGQMLVRDVQQKTVDFFDHKIQTPCSSGPELDSALKRYLFKRLETVITEELSLLAAAQASKPGWDCYESRVSSLANPDVYLDTLVRHLEAPSRLLSIEKNHLKLSKLGVKLNVNDNFRSMNEFDIHELIWGNGARNLILQIVYSES